MAINKTWHSANKMPTRLPAPERSDGGQENSTLDQRVTWHVEHARNCSCRKLEGKILAEIKKRGIKI